MTFSPHNKILFKILLILIVIPLAMSGFNGKLRLVLHGNGCFQNKERSINLKTNHLTQNFHSLVMDCLDKKDVECVKIFLNQWIQRDGLTQVFEGNSDAVNEILEFALIQGNIRIIKFLLRYGNHLMINENLHPAHQVLEATSSIYSTREVLQHLPANVSQKLDENQQNIFHLVLKLKRFDDIRTFLSTSLVKEGISWPKDFVGNSFNVRDWHGHTPIDYIVMRNDLQTFKFLLQNRLLLKLNVELENSQAWLLLSLYHQSKRILKFILSETEWANDLVLKYFRHLLLWIIETDLMNETEIDSLLSRYLILAHTKRCYKALDQRYPHLATKYAHALFTYSPYFRLPIIKLQ